MDRKIFWKIIKYIIPFIISIVSLLISVIMNFNDYLETNYYEIVFLTVLPVISCIIEGVFSYTIDGKRKKVAKENKKPIYKISIVQKYAKMQSKNNLIALFGILFWILIYFSIYYFFDIDIDGRMLVIICILVSLNAIRQMLLNYRIVKQYYGMNYDEARELSYFIKQSKDNDTYNGNLVFDKEKQDIPNKDKAVEYS